LLKGFENGRGRGERADAALAAERAHDLAAHVVDGAGTVELDRRDLDAEDLLERQPVALDALLVPPDVVVEMDVQVQGTEGPGTGERHDEAPRVELALAVGIVRTDVRPFALHEQIDVPPYTGQHGILALACPPGAALRGVGTPL
jgi:hypothetical protein